MTQTRVSFDFETYSEADIKKTGAWAYSEHDSTRVLCMAYAYNDEAPQLWLPEDPLPDFMVNSEGYSLHAWNCFFECCIWRNTLKLPVPPINQWHDTAAKSAAHGFPLALGMAGEAIGLPKDHAKDKRGRYLIQRLCKPVKRFQPELLPELYDYCKQDVVAEREIGRRLRDLTPAEREVWEVDFQININGILIDKEYVEKSIPIIERFVDQANQEVARITDGTVATVSQVAALRSYLLDSFGVETDSLDKASVAALLGDPEVHDTAKRLLKLRQAAAKTSNAKYPAILRMVGKDGRIHGATVYHGAGTGRWAGRLIQPQNLPRPAYGFDSDEFAWTVKQGNADLIDLLHDDPIDAFSSGIRGVIVAPEGHRLIVCDYSSIEARVLPWLSGQLDVLDVFASGKDVYVHEAAKIYGIGAEKVTKDQRMIGKIAILALGFGGGWRAFAKMANAYGLELSEEFSEGIKNQWREANKTTVLFWKALEKAAKSALNRPGLAFDAKTIMASEYGVKTGQSIIYKKIGNALYCKLPSGRTLCYPYAKLIQDEYGQKLVYMGIDSYTRKWTWIDTYGGKLAENVTQAVARDLLAAALVRLNRLGKKVVLHIHDEIVVEEPLDGVRLNFIEHQMCILPLWANGLPVDAEGFETARYRKD